jgi:hypothetical protein
MSLCLSEYNFTTIIPDAVCSLCKNNTLVNKQKIEKNDIDVKVLNDRQQLDGRGDFSSYEVELPASSIDIDHELNRIAD